MQIADLKKTVQLVILLKALTLLAVSQPQKSQLEEKGFININGIEQWITITGTLSKPVILFLHGGPGSPMSLYADAIFKGWEKDFILVQWDQRGAGKTFGRNAPDELTPDYAKAHPLTVSTMVADGIEVTKYLLGHLDKRKIILFGTSWGSVLGIQMAEKRPDLFYAYIGHSQLVDPANDLGLAFQKVHQMAKQANDQKSLEVLDSIGIPPYARGRTAGQFLRIIKKYEALHSKPAPGDWMKVSPGYDNEKDNQHRLDGDDYSFVHFVGDKHFGIQAMSRPSSGMSFEIPIYLIQGEHDILTPKEISKPYFDNIKAPKKQYILLATAAHGFNEDVVETLLKICKTFKQ